jgi:hypothetical protein
MTSVRKPADDIRPAQGELPWIRGGGQAPLVTGAPRAPGLRVQAVISDSNCSARPRATTSTGALASAIAFSDRAVIITR